MLCYFCVICIFCLLVVLVRLSVPVQVIDWKDSVSKMTYNVLMGTLNPTHSRPVDSASVNGRTGVLYVRKFDQNAQSLMARRIVRPK